MHDLTRAMRSLKPRASAFAAEDGFAVPVALSILAIAAMMVASTIALATHNTDRADRDQDAVRAGQAADAGVDAALYRLNKTLTASQAEGILNLPVSAVAETACVDVNVGQVVKATLTGSWCDAVGGGEQLDGGVAGGPSRVPASYSYRVSSGTNIGLDPSNNQAHLVDRRIVSTGVVDDVKKRVIATARARIGNNGNLLSVFEQIGYHVCTPEPPVASDPASGC